MSFSTSRGDYEIPANKVLEAQERLRLCSSEGSTEDMIATNDTLLNQPPPSSTEQQIPTNQTRVSSRFDADLKAKQQLHQKGSLSRVDYLKMVFDCSKWRTDSLRLMVSTISGIYGTLLVCTYICFSFTELVLFPRLHLYLEKQGFFIYLYLGSTVYFIYILVLLFRAGKSTTRTTFESQTFLIENHKSHGSVTVRFGAIIFGLGTFVYFFIELLDFLQLHSDSECYSATIGANVVLALIFVFLQTYLIFMYPRLNILCHKFFNRIGIMHVVATNIIIWIRTLIKESLEEIEEYEIEENHHSELVKRSEYDEEKQCDFLLSRMLKMEEMKTLCREHSRHFLPENILSLSSPYLYPFIIEYSLIGASVAYIMSNHIGVKPDKPSTEMNRIHRPHPVRHLRKSDFTHTLKGAGVGLVVLLIAIINLVLFFDLEGKDTHKDYAEYLSKASNTAINLVGITALIIGLAEMQHLENKDTEESDISNDLDMFLLRFTSFFSFMYMIFTIITGAFNQHVDDFPNELHIINGVCDLTQVFLQICFIHSLKQKAYMNTSQEYIMPGRQVTVFLFLFNLAQWIVFTFEIQKVRASHVEEEFYGFMSWVLIRRITLPLAVFFRFHSAVVSIELWKEVYSPKPEEITTVEMPQITTNQGDVQNAR